jgi:hypothetical protein
MEVICPSGNGDANLRLVCVEQSRGKGKQFDHGAL